MDPTETVGVPEIVPEESSKVRPDGGAGDIAQLATAPPVLVTVSGVIAEPTVAETVVAEYVIDGRATAAAFTNTVIVAVSLPVVLDAVIM